MSLLSSTFQVARWKRTGKDKNDAVTGTHTIEGSVRVNEAYCKVHYRSRVMLAVKSRRVWGLKWAALHFIKALCLSPGDIWVSVSVINVMCCVCIRWILLCMCSSSCRRIYQKQRFISTLLSPCLFAYKYSCGRPERSWVRSTQPQKNTEKKRQKV